MKLRQILPRDFPDFLIIFVIGVMLVLTVLAVQSGDVTSSIICGMLTLLACSGYCLIVHVNILDDRDRQRRDSIRDEESHQQEREEMMK